MVIYLAFGLALIFMGFFLWRWSERQQTPGHYTRLLPPSNTIPLDYKWSVTLYDAETEEPLQRTDFLWIVPAQEFSKRAEVEGYVVRIRSLR